MRSMLFETKKEDLARKVRAPAIADHWDQFSRWKETLRIRWRYEEHQNVFELHAVLLSLKHALLNGEYWGCRIMIFTDSMVSVCAGMKGRSSSTPLLRLLRQMAGVLLATQTQLYIRWVPGHRNLADGPSRGKPMGAPEISQRMRYDPVEASLRVLIDGVRM